MQQWFRLVHPSTRPCIAALLIVAPDLAPEKIKGLFGVGAIGRSVTRAVTRWGKSQAVSMALLIGTGGHISNTAAAGAAAAAAAAYDCAFCFRLTLLFRRFHAQRIDCYEERCGKLWDGYGRRMGQQGVPLPIPNETKQTFLFFFCEKQTK